MSSRTHDWQADTKISFAKGDDTVVYVCSRCGAAKFTKENDSKSFNLDPYCSMKCDDAVVQKVMES